MINLALFTKHRSRGSQVRDGWSTSEVQLLRDYIYDMKFYRSKKNNRSQKKNRRNPPQSKIHSATPTPVVNANPPKCLHTTLVSVSSPKYRKQTYHRDLVLRRGSTTRQIKLVPIRNVRNKRRSRRGGLSSIINPSGRKTVVSTVVRPDGAFGVPVVDGWLLVRLRSCSWVRGEGSAEDGGFVV